MSGPSAGQEVRTSELLDLRTVRYWERTVRHYARQQRRGTRSRTRRRGMPSPPVGQAGVPCCPAPVTAAAAPAPAPATPGAPLPQGSPAPRPAHRRFCAARLTRYRPSGSGPLLCRRPRARIGRPAQEQGGEGGDTEEAEEGGSRPWTWRLLRPYSRPLLVGERERGGRQETKR